MTRDTLRSELIAFRSTRDPIMAAVKLGKLLDAYNPVTPKKKPAPARRT